jgi:hypothetical protein
MKIYIPTRGRITNQLTLENLPPDLYVSSTLVCPPSEVDRLSRRYEFVGVLPQPEEKMTISEKRKWIVDQSPGDKLVMLDDDLRFAVRREDDTGKFRKATEEDILRYFKELEELLSEEVPHAGFGVRGMGIGEAAREGGWQTAKRSIYTLGYYLPIVRYWAEWNRVRTREDMDITLQLLSMGFPNKVNQSFVVDQKFGNEGGCSDERTIESTNEDARRLVELHPEYVSLEEKNYVSSIPRLEVRVQWQKALKDGLAFREQWRKTQTGNS